MSDGTNTTSLLRFIGLVAMGIGLAWVLQVLGLGGSSAAGRLLWVVSAATISGAGAGLVYITTALGKGAASARA